MHPLRKTLNKKTGLLCSADPPCGDAGCRDVVGGATAWRSPRLIVVPVVRVSRVGVYDAGAKPCRYDKTDDQQLYKF